MAAVTEVRKLLVSLRKNFHCTICLDWLTEPISTKCNHQFCSVCFKPLLSSSSRKNPSKCPLCKTGVTKRSVNSNPNLRNIVSAVRDVCEAADHDCLNLGGTPLLSPKVRNPIRTEDNNESKKRKKCLSFLGLEDETEESISKNGKDTLVVKKSARSVSRDKSKRVSEPPPADISSSLDTCDQDALERIYNSQNNLLNRLRKRKELKEKGHVVNKYSEKQEKPQKRKSEELDENVSDIGNGKKKKKKLSHNLGSVSSKQGNILKTSIQHDDVEITMDSSIDSSKNSKTSGEIHTQNNVGSTKISSDKKYEPINNSHIRTKSKFDENTVFQRNSFDNVPQSMSSEDTALVLPNAGFNLETISSKSKKDYDVSNINKLPECINVQQVNEEPSHSTSAQKHSDIISPSPSDNNMNKSLVDNEAFKSNLDNISSHQQEDKHGNGLCSRSSQDIEMQTSVSENNASEFSNQLIETEDVCENDLVDGQPSCEDICGNNMDDLDDNNMIATPENSDKYFALESLETPKSSKAGEEQLTKNVNIAIMKSPKTPTCGTQSRWSLSSPDGSNSLLKFPKTPKSSQIVRIESAADFANLMKKVPSPNKDHLLFGNLSFSKVSLPHRKENQSFRVSRRSINSGKQLLCQSKIEEIVSLECSKVNERDNDKLHSTDVKSMDECPQAETTQESDLSVGGKIKTHRKTRKCRNLKQTNRIEDMDCKEEETDILNVNGEEEKDCITEGSSVSSDKKTSKTCTEYSDEANGESMQSLLTCSTQESNPLSNKTLNKKLKSKRRKIVIKKGVKSVDNEELEKFNQTSESNLEVLQKSIPQDKKDGNKVQSCVRDPKCYDINDGDKVQSFVGTSIFESNETTIDYCSQGKEKTSGAVDKNSYRDIPLAKENKILNDIPDRSTKCKNEIYAKNEILENETEDIEDAHNVDNHSEAVDESFVKTVPQSEELIPPTPPVNNISSKLNITDKRYSMRSITEHHVENVASIDKRRNEISEDGISLSKKLTSEKDLYPKSEKKRIANAHDANTSNAPKPSTSQIQNKVVEKTVFDEELTCSDEAFFADVDKYESEEHDLKGKDNKISEIPVPQQKAVSKGQLDKEEKRNQNNNLIEDDLDSSFTCTDKMLCDEDEELTEKCEMATVKRSDSHNPKRMVSDDFYGISNAEEALVELEDDIEVYTGGERGNKTSKGERDDLEADVVEDADDGEFSVSMLSAAPHEMEEEDFGCSDETVVEEIMFVEGTKESMQSKDNSERDDKSKAVKTSSEGISLSLQKELVVDLALTPDQEQDSPDVVESENTEEVTAPPSTGKKFRQSFKDIIMVDSETSRPDQLSIDFSVCSPEVTEIKTPPTESPPYQDVCEKDEEEVLISPNNDKYCDKKRKVYASNIVKKKEYLGNFSPNEKSCIEIEDSLLSQKAKTPKSRKSYPQVDCLIKEKLQKRWDRAGDKILKQKKSKSLPVPGGSSKLKTDISIKQVYKQASNKEQDLSVNEDNEVEDQLFSPIPRRTLSRISGSKLKATKRTFSYNTDNTGKTGSIGATCDSKENVINISAEDNFLSIQKQNYEKTGGSGIVVHTSSKDNNSSIDELFEDYKSPPKVKRLSDENIPASLRSKSSQKEKMSFEQKVTTPSEDDELLDDSIWKISNIKQSTSRSKCSEKERYPFGENMFSPPTPVQKCLGQSNKKANILYKKMFSPPDSKKLLDESVEENSQKHKENIYLHQKNKLESNTSKIHPSFGNTLKEHQKVPAITPKPQHRQFTTPSTKTIVDHNELSVPQKIQCKELTTPKEIESCISDAPCNVKVKQNPSHTIKKMTNSIETKGEKVPSEFETPLKKEFVPMAQSTTFREYYCTQKQKNICDSMNKSKILQSTTQKETVIPSNTDHGTPKSIKENVLQNASVSTSKLCIPTPQVHTTTGNDLLAKNRPPVIMTSRLTKKQMMFCYSTCQKLGGKIVQNYTESVTHLIVTADENNSLSKMAYTYKYLMALVSGLWIVNLKWIFVSSQNGKFVEEDKFEAKGDPEAHHTNIPKLYRTASEAKRRCLFENYRMYVVGTFQQTQITREQLFMLLQKCGVEVIFSHTEAECSSTQMETVLLTDNISQLSEEDIDLCHKNLLKPVHPDWVVESIINFRVEDTSLAELTGITFRS